MSRPSNPPVPGQPDSRTSLPIMLEDWQRLSAAVIREQLTDGKESTPEAISKLIVAKITDEYGGQQIYIPFHFTRSNQAAEAVFECWHNSTPQDIALQHKQSLQWVYRMYKKGRKLAMQSRQADLFAAVP